MTVCQTWARFHEEEVQFDAECDNPDPEHWDELAGHPGTNVHHDADLGSWDRITGLHDRSLTPTEDRLKR